MSRIVIIAFLIMTLGCTDIGDFPRTFIVENATSNDLEILFYDLGTNLVIRTESISGPGIVFQETLITNARESNNPFLAFESDSIAIVFNNERIESHQRSHREILFCPLEITMKTILSSFIP